MTIGKTSEELAKVELPMNDEEIRTYDEVDSRKSEVKENDVKTSTVTDASKFVIHEIQVQVQIPRSTCKPYFELKEIEIARLNTLTSKQNTVMKKMKEKIGEMSSDIQVLKEAVAGKARIETNQRKLQIGQIVSLFYKYLAAYCVKDLHQGNKKKMLEERQTLECELLRMDFAQIQALIEEDYPHALNYFNSLTESSAQLNTKTYDLNDYDNFVDVVREFRNPVAHAGPAVEQMDEEEVKSVIQEYFLMRKKPLELCQQMYASLLNLINIVGDLDK